MISVNGRKVEWGKNYKDGSFQSGEVKCWRRYDLSAEGNRVDFHWLDCDSDRELIYLFFIAKDIKEREPKSFNTLVLHYIPNARLDKENDGDFLPANRYTAEFINSMGFDKVVGIEPHSSEFITQYKNAIAAYPTIAKLKEVKNLIMADRQKPIKILFPDKGSYCRYEPVIRDKYGLKNEDFLVLNKSRDNITREIKFNGLSKGIAEPGFDYVIIDDICDSGGTCIKAANEIIKMVNDRPSFYLLVAYFSKNAFKNIFNSSSPIKQVFVCEATLGFDLQTL